MTLTKICFKKLPQLKLDALLLFQTMHLIKFSKQWHSHFAGCIESQEIHTDHKVSVVVTKK